MPSSMGTSLVEGGPPLERPAPLGMKLAAPPVRYAHLAQTRSREDTRYFALEVQGSARLNRGHRNRVAAVTVARIAKDPRV